MPGTTYVLGPTNTDLSVSPSGDYSKRLDDTAGGAAALSSAEVAQATSAFTATANTTAALKTFTLPSINLGTWAAGDRLVVIYEFAGGGTMGNVSIGFEVGSTLAEVSAPWTIVGPVEGALAATQAADTLAAAG